MGNSKSKVKLKVPVFIQAIKQFSERRFGTFCSLAGDMLTGSLVLNQSGPTEFVFHVLTAVPELQAPLSCLFLLLYLVILCGNTAIIWVVCTRGSLRTPVYFFLANLSFVEISYSTALVPLMPSNPLGPQKRILLAGCGVQMFPFVTLGSTDCFLLAIMAYDRYVAICHPLHYTLIMMQKLCIQMVACPVGLAIFLSLQLTSFIFTCLSVGTSWKSTTSSATCLWSTCTRPSSTCWAFSC